MNKADAYVEYGAQGELDSQLRFTSSGTNGSIVRQEFKLVFDNQYTVPAHGNTPATEFIGPSRWRIDTPAEQWISVSSAVRYVTQVRDTTKDAAIRDNAAKTLAILGRYR